MSEKVIGFDPFFREDSRVLILGSFPSVKSRQTEFYYGNPQNSFWKILAGFFGEQTPVGLDEKKSLLERRKIALWDIVTECEITGSRDDTIKNFTVANLPQLLQNCQVGSILINGGKAYEIYCRYYKDLNVPAVKLPSTSPANTNTREKNEVWYAQLRRAFEST